MSQLEWRHHTLLQALLSRGPLKEREFHEVFAGVTGNNPATHKKLFNDCLLRINKEMDSLQFELRACMNQYDGNIYYGVVNNVADEQSKLGTKYSVPQIAFYKAIIEAIVQDGANQGCITSIEALNIRLENQFQAQQALQDSQTHIPAAFKTFSISQKEKTLNELIQDRWLASTSDGKIGLGVRSFLDLRSWFRNYDVASCDVCNEAAIKAEQCPKEGCPIRMHHYCLKKKFYKRKVLARACPACGTEWHHSDCIDEEEEATEIPPQSNEVPYIPVTRKRSTRRCKTEVVAANDAITQAPSGPALRKRLRSCKAEIVDAAAAGSLQSSLAPFAGVKKGRRSYRS